jgi:hypothetical protein
MSNSSKPQIDINKRSMFIIINMLTILLFAIVYFLISKYTKKAFNTKLEKKLTFAEALYFSAITHTTLGYGDILPTNGYSRTFAALQSMTMFVSTASFVL